MGGRGRPPALARGALPDRRRPPPPTGSPGPGPHSAPRSAQLSALLLRVRPVRAHGGEGGLLGPLQLLAPVSHARVPGPGRAPDRGRLSEPALPRAAGHARGRVRGALAAAAALALSPAIATAVAVERIIVVPAPGRVALTLDAG